MDPMEYRSRFAVGVEWTAVGLLIAAVVAAMTFGSGASSTGRGFFQLLCMLCVLTGALSMCADGAFRIVRSPLTVLLAGLPLVAALQILPGPWGEWSPLSWTQVGKPTASVDRHATMQWLIWSIALLGLLWSSAHMLRTPRHVAVTAFVLTLALGLSAAIGTMLRLNGSDEVFGIFRVSDSKAPAAIRDAFRPDSAIGAARHSPWIEVEDRNGATAWYKRQAVPQLFFAGFTDVSHWACCTIALLPLLTVTAMRKFKRPTSERGATEWLGLPEFSQGVCLTLFALMLTACLAWWGDPINVAVALTLAFVSSVALCHRNDRPFLVAVGTLQIGLLAALVFTRISLNGGFYWLVDRGRLLLSDNVSLARAFVDHLWLGCGLGAIADVWPLYRDDPANVGSQASSVLTFLVETGLVGGLLLIAGAVYMTGRWYQIRDELRIDDRRLLAALLAGLTSVMMYGLLGPGLEAPVAAALVVVLLGCAARGLAGGFATAGLGGGRV